MSGRAEDSTKNPEYSMTRPRFEPDTSSIKRDPFGQSPFLYSHSDLKVIQPIMDDSPASTSVGRLNIPTDETRNINDSDTRNSLKLCLFSQIFRHF